MLQSMEFSREGESILCYGQALRFASGIGFTGERLWQIATSVSELATNAIKYAGGGRITFRSVQDPRPGIEIVVLDRGTGIEHIEQACQDGFTRGRMLSEDEILAGTHGGFGGGLGAVRRLMDSVQMDNREGGGFRVVACKWLPEPGVF
ncbi:MAG: ATP-binding protein [Deltaproteobacteria bacterium]|nr:ATP-binding protein [Deltaproteobacteria bacterium]